MPSAAGGGGCCSGGDIVNEAAVAAGSDAPRYVVPFPGMGQQRRFLEALARVVPALPRAGEPH